jgi:hypothetical protein
MLMLTLLPQNFFTFDFVSLLFCLVDSYRSQGLVQTERQTLSLMMRENMECCELRGQYGTLRLSENVGPVMRL